MCKLKFGKYVRQAQFGVETLMLFDTDLLKEMMIKRSSDFTDRDQTFDLPPPFDRGMAALDGNDWRRVRHAVSPTFTSGKLKRMTHLVYQSVEKVTEIFKIFAKENKDINLKEIYGRLTVTVIAETMFGIEIDSMDNDSSFTIYARKFMNFSGSKLFIMCLKKIPVLNILFRNVEVIESDVVKFFTTTVEEAISVRKGKEHEFHDFLSLMLKAEVDEADVQSGEKNRGLTKEEIIGQAVLFLFAGHETTSAGLTYISYLLACNPHIQDRLREEILSEFNDDTPETIYESLSRMTFLDHCIKEGMRLYPPASMSDRRASVDTMIGHINVPKGSIVQIPIAYICRDPELWDDPDTFNPDRFASFDEENNKVPFQYIVFGNGPRNCLGMRFAVLELKMTLANIFRNVKFEVCENTPREPLEFEFIGLSKPKEPIIIRSKLIE